MDAAQTTDYTLLLVGLGIFLAVGLVVVLPNLIPTSRGRLNKQRRELRHRLYQHGQAQRAADKAARKFEAMNARASKVKPRVLRECEATAEDMRRMLVHAKDKVLVAENHVRKIILDEFPPAEHPKLVEKYLSNVDETAVPTGV